MMRRTASSGGIVAAVCVALFAGSVCCQNQEQFWRRARNEGFYRCIGSNTAGKGNIWLTGRGIGFIWDDPGSVGGFPIVPLLEVRGEGGVLPFMSVAVESRVISYFWDQHPQFGDLSAAVKATTPNNKDLRYNGFAAEVRYKYNFVKNAKSIGGLRNAEGFAFSPEGFAMGGSSLEGRAVFERDYLARNSKLPFKLAANVGVRVPFDADFVKYSQFLVDAAAAYVGLSFDVFLAYSFEGFFNRSLKAKMISFTLASASDKTWEVAFPENPMYVALGGRIRYPRGITMSAVVPLLLSTNVGSSIADKPAFQQQVGHPDSSYAYFEELARGITTPFDPWYAKWKVIAELSFPIRYSQTGAEMRRTFLLMKNRKKGKKIDIDERLRAAQEKALQKAGGGGLQQDTTQVDTETDKKLRLEAIGKRREQMKQGQ